jgi:mono/diheme cytochrome c family protein
MATSMAPGRLVFGLLLVVVGALSACDEPAPDLTEWTLADHDQPDPAPRRRGPAGQQPTHAQPSERNQVIDVTWQKQCASCHGRRGRGDGPSSTMVKARDLSRPEWQVTVTDAQLAEVIRKGKDKMPAFNLPDSIVAGLVQYVRALEEKPRAAPGAMGSPSATPVPSAAAPATPQHGTPAPNQPNAGKGTPTAPASATQRNGN